MKTFRLLCLLATAMVSAACSTAPKNALPFSAAAIGEPDSQSAILVIYRDLVPPYAYDVRIDVDGGRIGQLPNEAFTWIRIGAGEHRVEFSWPFIAGTGGDTVDLPAEPGGYYFLAIGGGIDGYIPNAFGGTVTMSSDIALTSHAQAMAELEQCCRYVPAKQ